MLNIVLLEPDIPQNLGAMLRLSACMGCIVHVIEPCGFPLNDQKLKRAGMDYMDKATMVKHVNWAAFETYRAERMGRLFLLETDGRRNYAEVTYQPTDYVMLGRESAGTPPQFYDLADDTLYIPMREGMRSLNVAMAAGMLVAEVARQRNWSFAA